MPAGATAASGPRCFFSSAAAPPFSAQEMALRTGYFMDNVGLGGSGSVRASPDPDTPGGSYY